MFRCFHFLFWFIAILMFCVFLGLRESQLQWDGVIVLQKVMRALKEGWISLIPGRSTDWLETVLRICLVERKNKLLARLWSRVAWQHFEKKLVAGAKHKTKSMKFILHHAVAGFVPVLQQSAAPPFISTRNLSKEPFLSLRPQSQSPPPVRFRLSTEWVSEWGEGGGRSSGVSDHLIQSGRLTSAR